MDGLDAEFDEFWAIYPRRVCKKAARIAFARARRSASADDIICGVVRYAIECRDLNREIIHIAHAATWLNGERWTDEPITQKSEGNAGRRDPDEVAWRRRVKMYQESKLWLPMWGDPPSHPSCYAPISVLAEFGFRNLH